MGSVVAKLFAMILEQIIASWAEENAVKGRLSNVLTASDCALRCKACNRYQCC